MQTAFQLAGLFFIIVAFISEVRQPLTRTRVWIVAEFLLAAVLFWTSEGLQKQARATTRPSKLDRSSVTASFNSISVEGAQQQLVFHYTLENATNHMFQIGQSACSMVSFRFAKKLATNVHTRSSQACKNFRRRTLR